MPGIRAKAIVAFATTLALQASPHRLRVYPNPSIRAFGIAQGPGGFLWLAAPDGLYRFDGFHYHKISAYPMASARFVAFTGDGSLWAGDFQGLARMTGGRFQKILNEPVFSIAAYPDRIFVEGNSSLIQIGLDNSVRRMNYRLRRELNIDSRGRIWGVCISPVEVCWVDPNNPRERHAVGPADLYYNVSPDSRDRVWVADGERALLFENPRVALERRPSAEGNRSGPLLGGQNGRLWFLGETVEEVGSGNRFRDRADHDRFAPLAGFEDPRGNVWLSSFQQGLVEWIPDASWERWFPEDFSGEPAVQVLRDQHGAILVATHKHIYRKEGDRWKRLTSEERRYDSLAILDGGGFLAAIRDYGVAILSPGGRILRRLDDLQPGRNQYREIVRDAKGRYWVGAKQGLFRLQGPPLRFSREAMRELAGFDEAVDLEFDKDHRLWIAYNAGVAWLDEQDKWHKIPASRPISTLRSIAVGPDEIWTAYRKPGLITRLARNGGRWDVTDYPYPPRDTYFIKRDSRGWIWRGTPNGVFISDGHHFAAEDWLHLHMGNGLAANELDQYGFFEDADGSVWIAGEEGVTHMRPDASWFTPPGDSLAPRLSRLELDGQSSFDQFPAELPSSLKTLRIDIGALGASPFRDAPLRWRLLPSKNWQASSDGTLEFRDLAKGRYSLEVANAGGPPVAVYSFRVGPALPWAAWVWWFAPAALIAPFALRKSAFAKARFQVQKSAFLLRRRFHRTAADAVPNDWSGEVLNGRYLLHRVLSRGGFSIVYQASDLHRPERPIAVKVLSRTARKDGWLRDRFAHEVSALRSIAHPGIVEILDSWISPAGEPCLAMPFLQGETLRHSMPGFGRARASTLIRRIAEALGEVHAHGIVHRDLKPENIILVRGGQPVIVDFGSAGLRSAENELAETTLIAGSFHYMAPERLTGRYSPASDVYSFGVIILELLTGKRLADLESSFVDPSFVDELSILLGSQRAASWLAPAFDPDPRRRPGSVKDWAEQIALEIDQA